MFAKAGARTPLPPDLLKMPEMWPSLGEAWDTFRVLSRSDGDIPVTDIIAWLHLRGIENDDEVEDIVRLVRALDQDLHAFQAEKISSTRNKTTEPVRQHVNPNDLAGPRPTPERPGKKSLRRS